MEANKLNDLIIKLLEDKKAENISVIDLSNRESIAQYMVFANGRSNKNVAAIGNYVADELKNLGIKHINMEGFQKADWVLVDTGDVIVHIFHPETREYYKIEEMWQNKTLNSY